MPVVDGVDVTLEALQRFHPLTLVTEKELGALLKGASVMRLPKGQFLFRKAPPPDVSYLLLSGEVESRESFDSRNLIEAGGKCRANRPDIRPHRLTSLNRPKEVLAPRAVPHTWCRERAGALSQHRPEQGQGHTRSPTRLSAEDPAPQGSDSRRAPAPVPSGTP